MFPLLINAVCCIALVPLSLVTGLRRAHKRLIMVVNVVIQFVLLIVIVGLPEVRLHYLESCSAPWGDLVN